PSSLLFRGADLLVQLPGAPAQRCFGVHAGGLGSAHQMEEFCADLPGRVGAYWRGAGLRGARCLGTGSRGAHWRGARCFGTGLLAAGPFALLAAAPFALLAAAPFAYGL